MKRPSEEVNEASSKRERRRASMMRAQNDPGVMRENAARRRTIIPRTPKNKQLCFESFNFIILHFNFLQDLCFLSVYFLFKP